MAKRYCEVRGCGKLAIWDCITVLGFRMLLCSSCKHEYAQRGGSTRRLR